MPNRTVMFSDYQPLIIRESPYLHREQILRFINTFPVAVFLDSNSDSGPPVPVSGIRFPYLAGAGVLEEISSLSHSFDDLQPFLSRQQRNNRVVFGYLGYDLKNQFESLKSANSDFIGFPTWHFFVPRHFFLAGMDSLTVYSNEESAELLWSRVQQSDCPPPVERMPLHCSMPDRKIYLDTIGKIMHHLNVGDIYEMNYCNEVRIDSCDVNALKTFLRLTEISPNPFSAMYSQHEFHLICASPERLVCGNRDRVYAQPMKGTAPRGDTPETDRINSEMLARSKKERSENVMITDLVRNDLSRIAVCGTVRVDELFGVHTFERSHQMISTVSAVPRPETKFTDIIRAVFPPGSMTGAPRISAMKLIEQFETFRRGLFSGSVGYLMPDGSFDFNVVIRSIQMNTKTHRASVAAGGAITASSIPEREYDEMVIKWTPQLKALGII